MMTEKKKPQVMILENDDEILEQARSILSQSGWDVTCEKTSKDALDRLTNSKQTLFALFITNSKLPKMEGDEILKSVKSISPYTQRMMMLPADNHDILINAINKAKVNACITLPINEENLITLARECFKKFKHQLKRKQLKRITSHQNKQMYQTAQKLKKKDDGYKLLIEEKKARILKLKSKSRKIKNEHFLKKEISLSDLVDQKNIQTDTEAFKNEFLYLCGLVKNEFFPLTKNNRIDPDTLNIFSAFSKTDTTETESVTAPPQKEDGAALKEGKTDGAETKPEQVPEKKPEQAGTEDSAQKSFPPDELVQDIIGKVLRVAMDSQTVSIPQADDSSDAIILETDDDQDDPTDESSHPLDGYYKITISDNQTRAVIKKRMPGHKIYSNHTSMDILDLLRHKQIVYGILDDTAIDIWLEKSGVDQITIASGEAADPGQDGKIKYHFETEFTNPGKINEDGTIDFRDRGQTPFVEKGVLLAEKTPAREGIPGRSLSATPIPVEEVIDPPFEAGPGTELSEDGYKITSAISGQPHLDKLGTISVNPEIVIPGDVDYETGNIDFQGNIVVKGLIKEGFKVKGINLIAQEIEGGIIDISGDLNVSAGINEATISAQGNIYAKFVNKSKIMGFGNLTVNKEIIDSTIHLSGKCINDTGHIISSHITAKLGIDAGRIGTTSSKPSTFKIGIDEHVNLLKKQVDEKLSLSVSKSKLIKDEIKKLETEDQALYEQISEKAHIQDRAQLDIKEMLKELKQLQEVNDTAQLPLVKDEIKKITETAKEAENQLNEIFEIQDRLANDIQAFKNQLIGLERENKTYVQEKKAITLFEEREKPAPVICVAKTIIMGTIIKGPHSSMVLNEDKNRCKIQELGIQEPGINLFEMTICDL